MNIKVGLIVWFFRLNFFLVDVCDGFGFFFGVFLMGYGWVVDDIGYVMMLGGIVGMLVIMFVGVLIDVVCVK